MYPFIEYPFSFMLINMLCEQLKVKLIDLPNSYYFKFKHSGF